MSGQHRSPIAPPPGAPAARRRAVSALVLGLLLVALAGCGGEAPAPARRPLRIGLHSDPLALDPHLNNEILTFGVLFNIYEGLTAFDPGLHVIPALAESWENPDELTWQFHLRRGVRFHDGRACTARDVVASLARMRADPENQLAGYFVEVTSMRALDDWTLEVRTARPLPVLLNKLASLAVAPWDSPPRITRPIGTGPYRFVSYQPGKVIELEAFPDYWGGPSAEPRVEMMPLPDPRERVQRLLAGEIDIAQEAPIAEFSRLERSPGCRLVWRLGLGVEYLGLRAGTPQFTDRRVREAISLALDRDKLVAANLAGHGQPVGQLLNENIHGYDPSIPVPQRDLPRARRLLAEAGYPDGLDLTLEMRQGRDGTALRDQLAEAGVRVRLEVRPWAEQYERLRARQVGFYFGGVLAPTADASDFLDGFAHSRDPERGYGRSNYLDYRNPELDLAIETSSATLDKLKRRQLLQRAIRLITDDLYYVPLYAYSQFYGVRDDVEWEPRLNSYILARDVRRRP